MEAEIFKSFSDAARICSISQNKIRYAIRNKIIIFDEKRQKKFFSLTKLKQLTREMINGEKFPTFKATAEKFKILPDATQCALKQGNSIIVRREDKKILTISSLSKRKLKAMISVRSVPGNEEYWFYTRNKVKEFF